MVARILFSLRERYNVRLAFFSVPLAHGDGTIVGGRPAVARFGRYHAARVLCAHFRPSSLQRAGCRRDCGMLVCCRCTVRILLLFSACAPPSQRALATWTGAMVGGMACAERDHSAPRHRRSRAATQSGGPACASNGAETSRCGSVPFSLKQQYLLLGLHGMCLFSITVPAGLCPLYFSWFFKRAYIAGSLHLFSPASRSLPSLGVRIADRRTVASCHYQLVPDSFPAGSTLDPFTVLYACFVHWLRLSFSCLPRVPFFRSRAFLHC